MSQFHQRLVTDRDGLGRPRGRAAALEDMESTISIHRVN